MDIPCRTLVSPAAELSVIRQCELLGVPRSTYYYQAVEPDEEEIAYREEMMAEIDQIHTQCPYFGQRKITKKLQEKGYQVGRKLVRSYMQQMGVYPIYPKPNLSKRNFKEGIVPYLLRNMLIYLPNQVWAIDITYIKMAHGHMFLSAIIDWYSRKIVGWELSDALDTTPVLTALEKAIATHGTPGIINSDQGTQFTSKEYKEFLKEKGIRQSMDGKSRWADNVLIERWFRSLKTEKIYINEFPTPRALYQGIKEYIDEYNTERPHEALDYATPNEIYASKFQTMQLAA